MQVTLDAIDWNQLLNFSTPGDFIEWLYEIEDEEDFRSMSCYDNGWISDSVMQYFEVAGALKHLAEIGPSETATHLREGIMKLISENGHIDEFHLADASEGCYWISASPASVVTIKSHLDSVDIQACVTHLRNKPPKEASNIMKDLDNLFVAFINQHRHMIDLAVANGYGLLGHCG